jgi:hypothetical protein
MEPAAVEGWASMVEILWATFWKGSSYNPTLSVRYPLLISCQYTYHQLLGNGIGTLELLSFKSQHGRFTLHRHQKEKQDEK